MNIYKLVFILSLTIISGCQTGLTKNEEVFLSPLGKYYWENPSLETTDDAVGNFELVKAKSRCTVEKLSLQIPAPSCYQPPKGDCTGMTGFALGFCRSYTPPKQCDYSAVQAAKNAQVEIWDACMTASGWISKFTSIGFGGDTTGGYFSKPVVTTAGGIYSIKLESMAFDNEVASAIIRRSCDSLTKCKPNQDYYEIDLLNNTFKMGRKVSQIEIDSEIPVLFEYIKKKVRRKK